MNGRQLQSWCYYIQREAVDLKLKKKIHPHFKEREWSDRIYSNDLRSNPGIVSVGLGPFLAESLSILIPSLHLKRFVMGWKMHSWRGVHEYLVTSMFVE